MRIFWKASTPTSAAAITASVVVPIIKLVARMLIPKIRFSAPAEAARVDRAIRF
jgi:hypothetical protein